MMSYVPDAATHHRLVQECRRNFPGLPENLILTVLHENKYDLARSYNKLKTYHTDLVRTRPQHFQPTNHQPNTPYPYNLNHQPHQPRQHYAPPPVPLHHSHSDSMLGPHYPNYGGSYGGQYGGARGGRYPANYPVQPPPPSMPYTDFNRSAQPYPRASSPQPYPRSTSPQYNRASPPQYNRPSPPQQYARATSPRPAFPSQQPTFQSPSHYYPPNPPSRQPLFVDTTGDAGRHYVNVDDVLSEVRAHAPQQCTEEHSQSLAPGGYARQTVSPIDMRVPKLAFPVIEPSQSPINSPHSVVDGRSLPVSNQDHDKAYASALILQQRARMSKLHKHLIDKKQELDKLSKEVLHKETRLLGRYNEIGPPESVAKLVERNRSLQVQNQLLSHELEHYSSGAAPLGVIDPKNQENFHQSMTALGQSGPLRLPDNTPVHISHERAYDRHPEQDEGEPWDCNTCTFKNHPAMDKCEFCEFPRNTSLPK